MTKLQHITEAFKEIIDANTFQIWINTTYQVLNNKSPLQLINEGKEDQIWQIYWYMRGY